MKSNPKILAEIATIEKDYYDTPVNIIDGLPYRQYERIKVTEFYSNSRYLLGQKDAQGRDKPFYNITNGMVDVEDAAKDIDTKDIQAVSDNDKDYDKSYLLSMDIYEWMKETNFGKTINELRTTHTKYGGVLAKKCIKEEGGKETLEIGTPAWKNLVTDQNDIINGVIIEKHWMSPSELAKKMDTWENVKEAIRLATKRRNEQGNTGAEDVLSNKVPIREVRGEFTKAMYKEAMGETVSEDDKYQYSYQLYIIAGDKVGKGYVLYCEDDTERVYKYLARKPKPGRGLGVGVYEEGEEAQVWTNDSMQKFHRALELSSKWVGQSSSRKLRGRNILTEVEEGTILETEDNKPINGVQMVPSGGLQQFQLAMEQWFTQYEKASSAYAAQRGESPNSSTPFRLQAMVLQQSSSVFDTLREELGIFITEIFNDWIIPYLASRINREHILSHEFSADELKELDKNYAVHNANQQAIEQILNGKIVNSDEYNTFVDSVQELNKQTKSYRFIDIPKDYYKDLEAKVTVITTGEQRNKAAMMESLYNLLTSVAANPMILQDPVMSQLFLKIVELSGAGISPVQITAAIQQQAQQSMQEQQQQALNAPQGPQVPQASLSTNPVQGVPVNA